MTGALSVRHGVRDNGAFRLDGTRRRSPRCSRRAATAPPRSSARSSLDARFGLEPRLRRLRRSMLGSSTALEPVQRDVGTGPRRRARLDRRRAAIRESASRNPERPGSRGSTSTIRTTRTRRRSRTARAIAPRPTTARSPTPTPRSASSSPPARRRARATTRSSSSPPITAKSLGEHGERTHGLFAYEATLRVPLIVWCARPSTASAVVRDPVRLVDVAPTVLDLVGAPALAAADGRSLRPSSPASAVDDPGRISKRSTRT